MGFNRHRFRSRLALKAKEELQKKGKDVSVVSLPSWERFEAQSEEYKNTVISPELKKRMTIEAGTTYGWANICRRSWSNDRNR